MKCSDTVTRSTSDGSAAAGVICRNRKRRFLVNLFRNKRRRFDRFWKDPEFARYLLERLLLVGPVQGGVVEALHDGGFDDFEIGRDVEIARHVQR